MKTKHIIIIVTAAIVFTAIFCVAFASVSSKSKSRQIYEAFSDTNLNETQDEFENDTTEMFEINQYEETDRLIFDETVSTSSKFKTQDCIDILVSKTWELMDGSKLVFDRYGNAQINDEKDTVILTYTYTVEENTVNVFSENGEKVFCLEYDLNSGNLNKKNTSLENFESKARAQIRLNYSNAHIYLADTIKAYNGFVHTNNNNFELDYSDSIICYHCRNQGYSGEAFRVKNFSSIDEIEEYIDKNLTGDAKKIAKECIKDSIDSSMIFEQNGKLYVCRMYNEKGYESLNADSVEIYSFIDDGSYIISVKEDEFDEDYEFNEYLFVVVYENGAFKISSEA